jgi:hypothetical protein
MTGADTLYFVICYATVSDFGGIAIILLAAIHILLIHIWFVFRLAWGVLGLVIPVSIISLPFLRGVFNLHEIARNWAWVAASIVTAVIVLYYACILCYRRWEIVQIGCECGLGS